MYTYHDLYKESHLNFVCILIQFLPIFSLYIPASLNKCGIKYIKLINVLNISNLFSYYNKNASLHETYVECIPILSDNLFNSPPPHERRKHNTEIDYTNSN